MNGVKVAESLKDERQENPDRTQRDICPGPVPREEGLGAEARTAPVLNIIQNV